VPARAIHFTLRVQWLPPDAKSTVQRAAQHLGVQKIRSKDDSNRFLRSLRFDPDASDGCGRRDQR